MIDPNSDETLATALMAGFVKGQDEGKPEWKYLDGEEEDRARTAMARLLRSGLPLAQNFRNQLAELFDPIDHPAVDRKLVFKRRGGRGRPRNHVRNTAIAYYIRDCMREDDVEKAQHKAAKFFNLSFEAIRDIWGHSEKEGYRKLLPMIDGEVVK
jgi:hypothetical protein